MAAPQISPPYLVASGSANGASTLTAATTAPVAAGDAIIVFAGVDAYGVNPLACSDNGGTNVYTEESFGETGSTSLSEPVLATWICEGSAGLSVGSTITTTWHANGDIYFIAVGCPGLSAAGAIDQIVTGWTSGGDLSLVSATLQTAPELGLAMWGARAGQGAPALSAGWTSLDSFQAGGNTNYVDAAWQIFPTSAEVTAEATTPSSGLGFAGILLTLKGIQATTATAHLGGTGSASAVRLVSATATAHLGLSAPGPAETAPVPAPALPVFPAGYTALQGDFTTWVQRSFRALTGKVVFRATQTGTAQSLAAGAYTALALNSILEDPYGGWSATSTSKQAAHSWLAPWTGYYQVTFGGGATPAAGLLQSALGLSGANPWLEGASEPVTSGLPGGGSCSFLVPMTGGTDYLQFLLQPSASGVSTDTASAGTQPWVEIVPAAVALVPVLTTGEAGVQYLALTGGVLTGPLTLDAGLIIPGGAQNGYVWTSDAAGNGSWQPGASSGIGTSAWLIASVPALAYTSLTRNSDEAAVSGTVAWPDGTTGTYTADVLSTAFPGAVDAWHVSYGAHTVTQHLVTRDASGAVTAQPALVVT